MKKNTDRTGGLVIQQQLQHYGIWRPDLNYSIANCNKERQIARIMSHLSLLILVIDPLLDIHLPVVGTDVKLNVHLNNEGILFSP